MIFMASYQIYCNSIAINTMVRNDYIQLFHAMKILSVNVSRPQPIVLEGRQLLTGIFKQPVEGPVYISRLNVEGDSQADPTVHGGLDKATYAYPHEHYAFWEKHMGAKPYPMGQFGENLTTHGLLEDELYIGDIIRAGSAALQVSHPRQPCWKLGAKMGKMSFIREFQQSLRVGFYFRVMEEGNIKKDDTIEFIERDPAAVTVAELASLLDLKQFDSPLAKRILKIESLADKYRAKVENILTDRSNRT